MDWLVRVLVIVVVGVLAGLAWRSSGRTAKAPDHGEGRHPGQLDHRSWS